MSVRRRMPRRDQAASRFSAVLMRLCDSTGAIAAALVDREGETVDYFGDSEPFDIKIAAAEWRLVLQAVEETQAPIWANITQLAVRAERATYHVIVLSEGYALVVWSPRRSFELSERALTEAIRETSEEAGLVVDAGAPTIAERWTAVEVRSTADGQRPAAVWCDGDWQAVEILGRCTRASVARSERGFRVRLPTGIEITLVRESLGHWFADGYLERSAFTSNPGALPAPGATQRG